MPRITSITSLFFASRPQGSAGNFGLSWTLQSNIFSSFYTPLAVAVDASGTNWMTVGSGSKCATSTDNGVTWTDQSNFTTVFYNGGGGDAQSLATNGTGTWIAGGGQGECARSTDNGVNWTRFTLSSIVAANNNVYAIVYGNGIFVAIGGAGPTSQCYTSSDGVTWTERTSFSAQFTSGAIPLAAVWTGSQFVVVGDTCATSSDGITWTRRTSFDTATSGQSMWAVAANSTTIVAVGGGATCVTSTDGITWTARTFTVFGGVFDAALGVKWNGKRFVAIGQNGKYAQSLDGTTWSTGGSNYGSVYGTTSARAIANNATTFVVVGDSGKVSTSNL